MTIPTTTDPIVEHLRQVADERAARANDPALGASVLRLKAYQQQRFRFTYCDLLDDPRYAAATRFFLDELYGPGDHTLRDAQFERIVPAIERLFPRQVLQTVEALAALHALSEQLDTEMGRQLQARESIRAADYAMAWAAVDRRADRERQIALALEIGRSLDRYTRSALLRKTLHLMRRPARAAGLEALQGFLERGFEAFGAMSGAVPFLETIRTREAALLQALFDPRFSRPDAAGAFGAVRDQLP